MTWFLTTLLAGCIIDMDDRCGANMEPTEWGCDCVDDAIYTEAGTCELCGEHEVASGNSCECAEGWFRPAEGEACIEAGGLGASCDPDGEPCEDPTYEVCRASNYDGGYCTNTCTTDADCVGGYACDEGTCERPPVGQGQACESQDDCADLEATYCETYFLKQCLVPDCTTEPDSCFAGWECCDLSDYGMDRTLCVEAGACL